MYSDAIVDVLRAVASSLKIPTITILIFLIAVTIVMLGSIIAEYFTERRHLKVKMPELIPKLQNKNTSELVNLIDESGLLKSQKKAAHTLIEMGGLPEGEREALARQLLFDEQNRYEKITKITDLIARIAPMFGLMGTLIPLGPGLVALGQGDTKTLSSSLLIAFDTTVAGLVSAAISYIISSIRSRWYEQYMVCLETLMECILEEQAKGGNKNENQ